MAGLQKPGLLAVLAIVACCVVIVGAANGFRLGGGAELMRVSVSCEGWSGETYFDLNFDGTPFRVRGGVSLTRFIEPDDSMEWCQEAVASLSETGRETFCSVGPEETYPPGPPSSYLRRSFEMLCSGGRRDVLRTAAILGKVFYEYRAESGAPD